MDEVKMAQVDYINLNHLLETTILDTRLELLLQKVLSFDQIDCAIERFQCALRKICDLLRGPDDSKGARMEAGVVVGVSWIWILSL
jgi:hypothetical protein